MRKFADLSERELLALAISNEEEDGRIYADYAEGLRENYPSSAKIFQEYCYAQPGDAYYGINVQSLPIDRDLLASLVNLAKMTTDTGFCPRLADDVP